MPLNCWAGARVPRVTSKQIVKEITANDQESRRNWMLWMFKRAAAKSSNVSNYQFWQHHNKPIELWSPDVIQQKIDYIHNNPVKAGYVNAPEHWKYSSAVDYNTDIKGLVELAELY